MSHASAHEVASASHVNLSIGVTLGSYTRAGNESEVFQFNPDRLCHTVVIGKTGAGKSNHVQQMEREDILSGGGLAIIAAHEDDALYALSCVPPERMDDVVVIDATDPDYLPCLNPLDVDPYDDAAVDKAVSDVLELLTSTCARSWAGPRFETLVRRRLLLMLHPRFPVAPHIGLIQRLFDDADFVGQCLDACDDPLLRQEWRMENDARRSSDYGDLLEWAASKASVFASDHTLAALFSAGPATIDFDRVVDESQILVALVPDAYVGAEVAGYVRTWILMRLRDALMRRGARLMGTRHGGVIANAGRAAAVEPDPFMIYVDEFGSVASSRFAQMLPAMRKYGAGLVLSFQDLEQLRVLDTKADTSTRTDALLGAVLGNVGTFLCYPMGPKDAATLARLFCVDEERLLSIKPYRPLVRWRNGGADMGPATLAVSRRPEPDDLQMPARIVERLMRTGALLPCDGDRDGEDWLERWKGYRARALRKPGSIGTAEVAFFDKAWLDGLGVSFGTPEETSAFLAFIGDEYEIRIGENIARGVDERHLDELEAIDPNDDGESLWWFERHCPDGPQIVEGQRRRLEREVAYNAGRIEGALGGHA